MPQPFLKSYSKEAIKQLVDLSSDSRLICVSLMSNYWDNAVQVTEAIKQLKECDKYYNYIHCHSHELFENILSLLMDDNCFEV